MFSGKSGVWEGGGDVGRWGREVAPIFLQRWNTAPNQINFVSDCTYDVLLRIYIGVEDLFWGGGEGGMEGGVTFPGVDSNPTSPPLNFSSRRLLPLEGKILNNQHHFTTILWFIARAI